VSLVNCNNIAASLAKGPIVSGEKLAKAKINILGIQSRGFCREHAVRKIQKEFKISVVLSFTGL